MWSSPRASDSVYVGHEDQLLAKGNEKNSHYFPLLKIEIKLIDQLLLYKPILRKIWWIRKKNGLRKI